MARRGALDGREKLSRRPEGRCLVRARVAKRLLLALLPERILWSAFSPAAGPVVPGRCAASTTGYLPCSLREP